MDVIEQRHGGAQKLVDGHGLRVLARKLGVETRSIGDVADQPVEPPHVVLNDLHQPLA